MGDTVYRHFRVWEGLGDMGSITGRMRFPNRPEMYFAMLVAALMVSAMSLLAIPGRALAAPADLSITKQGPESVEPGQEFDYVLTVSNAAGAQAATAVTVTDELPGGVTLVGSEPDVCGPLGSASVNCTLPTLAAGESTTITLRVRAPEQAGTFTNVATAGSADDTDSPVSSNGVTTTVTPTTVAPNLVIEKLDDPDPVSTEGILLYTLRVQNQGEEIASGVAVTDELPLDAVDFVTVSSHDFDCTYTAGAVQCTDGLLGPGEIAEIVIAVEPEKAGTIQNLAAVFAQDIKDPLDTDTEDTVVKDGGGGGGGGGDDNPTGPTGPGGPDVPQGDQCSPVINLENGTPLEVISGTNALQGTFENFYNDTLPLRIAYATSSEDGSLTITLTRKDNKRTILDKKIDGKKRGVEEVDTEAGATYDVAILPDNQGYAVDLQIGTGTDEPCTNPDDLDPPGGSGGTNGNNGANDVIDETVSHNPLPDTGGPPLLGLAIISLGLAVCGATLVGVGSRRRRGR